MQSKPVWPKALLPLHDQGCLDHRLPEARCKLSIAMTLAEFQLVAMSLHYFQSDLSLHLSCWSVLHLGGLRGKVRPIGPA